MIGVVGGENSRVRIVFIIFLYIGDTLYDIYFRLQEHFFVPEYYSVKYLLTNIRIFKHSNSTHSSTYYSSVKYLVTVIEYSTDYRYCST